MALIKCEQCGQTISDKATQCPKCGWSVEAHNSESQQESSKQPNESKGVMVFAIVAAILIICGIIFTWIYGSNHNALLADTTTTDSTATEVVEEVATKEVVPPTPSKTDLQHMGFKGKVKDIIFMCFETAYSYSFDEKGNLTTCYNGKEQFNFNQKGELVSSSGEERENEFDDDGTPYSYTYTYEKQNDKQTTIYETNGYTSEKSKYADLYFDDKGRIVKIHFFRENPSNDSMEIHYDSENNAYDKDNNPIVLKCALAVWMQHINSTQFTKSHDEDDKKESWNGPSEMEYLSVYYW